MKNLTILRLDKNSLTGPVPFNINNLTNIGELHLTNNMFTGPLPNLTGMNALRFVDMRNNSFDPSDIPSWFSTLPLLTTLYLENLNIGGQLPQSLFSFSLMDTLRLRNNCFNGTLDIGARYSSQLALIDLQTNQIEQIVIGGVFNKQIILVGNPVCNQGGNNLTYCKPLQLDPSYSTPRNCVTALPTCPSDQTLIPSCSCAYPYEGTLYFRAPSFSDLGNVTYYLILERELKRTFVEHQLPVDSVSLENPHVDSKSNLIISLQVFPSGKILFSERDILEIGFIFSDTIFWPPSFFVCYYFVGQPYTALNVTTPTLKSKQTNHLTVIIGATIGAVTVSVIMFIISPFAVKKRRHSNNLAASTQSFGSWDPNKRNDGIQQMKTARLFSFEEIQKYTNNFLEANYIGSGGYGKVYRGMVSNGRPVAVKRAQQCSFQGGLEFKTEIELLSRVHHKNLVTLVGFCFDQGEKILVYEYVPNGTLKDSLSVLFDYLGANHYYCITTLLHPTKMPVYWLPTRKSGVSLDWRKRVQIALGSARGLVYLHELASPSIIHRDIKSSNILLDEHLNAKVSDFGISRSLEGHKRSYISTQVKGTMGYLDPEYYMTEHLTKKSDVYSFGVLLLEIVNGKNPVDRGRYIVTEVKALLDKSKDLYGLSDLLDPAIGLGTTLGGFEDYIDLAMKCLEDSGADRPTMGEVAIEIQKIMQLAAMTVNADSGSPSGSCEGTNSSSAHHSNSNEDSF